MTDVSFNNAYESPLAGETPMRRSQGTLLQSQAAKFVLLALLHIPLALAMNGSSMVATLHALLTVLLGLWWAATTGSLQQVAYIACYIVGAEVLWRMTEAGVFWEYGKYAIILIFGVALLRTHSTRIPLLALTYFLLLLPAALLTLFQDNFTIARQLISFNLSGHLALFVCIWFFGHLRLSMAQLRWLLLILIVPIVGMATITLSFLSNAQAIRFPTESSFAASGGFGPNQVSMVFGLGVVAVWYLLLYLRLNKVLAAIVLVLGIWFLLQGLLTFSRGGMIVAAIVMAVITLQGITNWRQLASRIAFVLLAALITVILIPEIDSFTQGALGERYQDTELSNRDKVIQVDWQLFLENPIAGIGVGLATEERRALINVPTAAHTEFTRLLAEHGMLGVLALLLLAMMGLHQFLKSWRNPAARAFVLGLTLWSLLSMTHSAMRIAAIPAIFGLAFTQFEFGSTGEKADDGSSD